MGEDSLALVFTDIEGSTQHLLAVGDREWVGILAAHQRIVRDCVTAHAGREVKTDGDAFFLVFPTVDAALAAAVAIHERMAQFPWTAVQQLRVRIGVHSGVAVPVGDDFAGVVVHEAARTAAAGHGGQVVVSAAAREQATRLPPGTAWQDLGLHLLKDFPEARPLWQLVHAALPSGLPPLRTASAPGSESPQSQDPPPDLAEQLAHLSTPARRALVSLVACAGGADPGTLLELAAGGSGQDLVELAPLVRFDQGRYDVTPAVRTAVGAGWPDAVAAARERHARWCSELAQAASPHLTGPDQVAWTARLTAEDANLEAAVRHLLAEDLAEGQRMVAALARFWEVTGRWTTGAAHLRAALAHPPADLGLRAVLHFWSGNPRFSAGDLEAAGAHERASLGLARSLGDQALAGASEDVLGVLARLRGDHDLAAQHFARAVQLCQAAGDRRGVAVARANTGGLALAQGRPAEARAALTAALEELRALGDVRLAARAESNLGHALALLKQPQEARRHLESALATTRELGDPEAEAVVLGNLALVLNGLGFERLAAELQREALHLHRTLGNTAEQARLLRNLDSAELAEPAEWREAREVHRALGDAAGTAWFATRLVDVALREGDHAGAVELAEEARRLYAEAGPRDMLAYACLVRSEVAQAAGDQDSVAQWLDGFARVLESLPDRHEVLQELIANARHEERARREVLLLGLAAGWGLPGEDHRVGVLRTVLGAAACQDLWQRGVSLAG